MSSLHQLKEYYLKNKDKILSDYFDFLRFPSISADPAYASHTNATANWLKGALERAGFLVQKWETEGAPILFGEINSKKDKTLLLYTHYDVQPVDPLDLWLSPPFEPTLRHGEVYARGASDDKGETFYTLSAINGLLHHLKTLPINIKWIIEGEEESGSTQLSKILKSKEKEIAADYLIVIDSGLLTKDRPAISFGVRGICSMTLTLTGSNSDLHSGSHGGIVYNPNRALVELLASLHDTSGRVTIDGFYDDVKDISDDEKRELFLDFDDAAFEKSFLAKANGGEKGYSPSESAWLRPTLEINGLSGGYSGKGFKTVIPATACAKISCRLVPNQDADKIAQLVKNHLLSHVKEGIRASVEIHSGGNAFRSPVHSPLATTMRSALEEVFQAPCQNILMGGSIPIISQLANHSHAETLLFGMGLPDDNVHAPNEHFGLDRFERGYLSIANIVLYLGKLAKNI